MRLPYIKIWRGLSSRRQLQGLVIFQLVAVISVALYAIQNPLIPDHGLQQLDAMTLHEKVLGLSAIENKPTLVIAAGNISDESCKEKFTHFVKEYGKRGGLDPRFSVIILSSSITGTSGLVQSQSDPEGELAKKLALPLASKHCQPGYAILDGQSNVRYRTYDPNYQSHTQEQNILLESLLMTDTSMEHEQ